jgi:hypothetical protein
MEKQTLLSPPVMGYSGSEIAFEREGIDDGRG